MLTVETCEKTSVERAVRTVASLKVIDSGAILLVSKNGVHWNLPGGEVQKGETAASALARELLEELSARPSVTPYLYLNTRAPSRGGIQTQYMIYACSPKALGPIRLNRADKIDHYMWTTNPRAFDLNPVTRLIVNELSFRAQSKK